MHITSISDQGVHSSWRMTLKKQLMRVEEFYYNLDYASYVPQNITNTSQYFFTPNRLEKDIDIDPIYIFKDAVHISYPNLSNEFWYYTYK